jgi:hypothetical protein
MDACSRATFIDDGQRWEMDILGHRVLSGGGGGVLGYLYVFDFKFPSYRNAGVDIVSQNKKKKPLFSSLPPICSFSFYRRAWKKRSK